MRKEETVFSRYIRKIAESATLSTNERSTELEREGAHIYRLGFGESPFPVPEVAVKALREYAHVNSYLPVKGLPELRQAAADFHQRRYSVDAHPDRILIGPGSKQLMFLLQVCLEAEVLLPTPCWVSYAPQADILKRKVTLIETSFAEEWKLTANKLEQAIDKSENPRQPKLLILNYPGNPTSVSYSGSELDSLAQVASKYGLVILSDEIYGELRHDGNHVSMAALYPEGTVVSSGLSKWCGAGGWRLGTFVFPPELSELMEAVCSIASGSHSTVSAPIQYAAAAAYSAAEEIDTYLFHCRRLLKGLGDWCGDRLTEAGIRFHPSDGGFYLFPEFSPFRQVLLERGVTTSTELCERILEETGVVLLTGEAFGREAGELNARLAYVNFDGRQALDASSAVPLNQELGPSFLRHYCSETMEAIERVTEWCAQLEGKPASKRDLATATP